MPVATVAGSPSGPVTFRVPSSPKEVDSARWYAPGEAARVCGLVLPGGMIYVGSKLGTPYSGNDPCLIDPALKVTFGADLHQLDMGYWPSYSGITPLARGAYLQWLAGGRCHPDADIGLVFLFFYGLERRAIIDAQRLGAAVAYDMHSIPFTEGDDPIEVNPEIREKLVA